MSKKSRLETKDSNVRIASERILSVACIRNAIRQGHTYCSDLAKYFKVTKQTMSYWLKKLEKNGEVKIDILEGSGKVAKYYRVVETIDRQNQIGDYCIGKKGEYFIDSRQKTFEIITPPKWFFGKEWKLNKGVTYKSERICNFTFRINNNKSLTVIYPKITSDNENDLIDIADKEMGKSLLSFLSRYPDMKLGKAISENKGAFGSVRLRKYLEPLTKNVILKSETFDVDNTPTPGSVEFNIGEDPMQTAMKLHNTISFIENNGFEDRLKTLENAIVRQSDVNNNLSRNIELHLEVMTEIKDAIKELRDLFKVNGKSNPNVG